MKITPFQQEYAEKIIGLWELASQDTISGIVKPDTTPKDFSQNINSHELGKDAVQLAWDGCELVSFVFLDVFYDDFHSMEEKSFFVNILFVHPDYRAKGIGTSLLHQSVSVALKKGYNRVFAEVNAENIPMLRLVKKMGWRIRSTSFTVKKEDGVSLERIKDFLRKTHYQKNLDLRLRVVLQAKRGDLDLPSPRDTDSFTVRQVKESQISELAKLDYSDIALQEASKGMAVIAIRDNEIIGACTSIEGFIHYVKVKGEEDIHQRMVQEMISILPKQIEKVCIEAEDISLAVTAASWGFQPTTILLDGNGDILKEGSNLLSEFGIHPSRRRFIVDKVLI